MNYNSEIIKDWSSLGYFRRFTPQKYYAVCGCFIIGFELSSARCDGYYRTYFVMYPLWKKTIKDCMHHPYFYRCIENYKGRDLEIPYTDHHNHFSKSIIEIKNELGFIFNNISIKEIYTFLEKKYNEPEFRFVPVLQAYIFVCELCLFVFVNDEKIINIVLEDIKKKSKGWNIDKFKYWGNNFNEWYNELIKIRDNREQFLKQIETNINSEKLRKLPRYNLIP